MRCSSNAHCSARDRTNLSSEPMFCLETAVNMLYFSALVYDIDEVQSFPKSSSANPSSCLLLQTAVSH